MLKFLAGFCVLSLALTARADELITNGGFETGDFTGWAIFDSGGPGSFFVTSTPATPLNGLPTAGPSGGFVYAVSDQFGPGSHALVQSFVVPLDSLIEVLSFDMFVNDWGAPQFGGEADLLAAGADPLSGVPLAVFYSSDAAVSSGVPNSWVHRSLDITAAVTPGTSYQLRFFESDSTAPLNVGVDNVSLTTAVVPEPKTLVLPVVLILGLLAYVSQKSQSRA